MYTVSSGTHAQNRKHNTQHPAAPRRQPPSTAHTHVHRHQDRAPARHKGSPGAPTKPALQPASPPALHTSSHHGSYEGTPNHTPGQSTRAPTDEKQPPDNTQPRPGPPNGTPSCAQPLDQPPPDAQGSVPAYPITIPKPTAEPQDWCDPPWETRQSTRNKRKARRPTTLRTPE